MLWPVCMPRTKPPTPQAGLWGCSHRDVSTHNLLVGRDGVTRLADFGIAKSAVSTAVTEQGHVEGKLIYMAPEYVQKLPVDRTLDVYAIGMTLSGRACGSGAMAGL